jgi:hypothetical protein
LAFAPPVPAIDEDMQASAGFVRRSARRFTPDWAGYLPGMTSATFAPHPAEPTRLRWWLEDSSGKLVLGQPPNLAATASSVLLAAARVPFVPDRAGLVIRLLGNAALCWWAGGELVSGVTPVRRVIGGVVLGRQVARLAAARSR